MQPRRGPGKTELEMPQARPKLAAMGSSSYTDIKDSLLYLCLHDPRPWLVGFSGDKQSHVRVLLMGSGATVVSSFPEEAVGESDLTTALRCTDERQWTRNSEDSASSQMGLFSFVDR